MPSSRSSCFFCNGCRRLAGWLAGLPVGNVENVIVAMQRVERAHAPALALSSIFRESSLSVRAVPGVRGWRDIYGLLCESLSGRGEAGCAMKMNRNMN